MITDLWDSLELDPETLQDELSGNKIDATLYILIPSLWIQIEVTEFLQLNFITTPKL